MEIVAVLSLLALFTHQHIFWIAALLLALIEFPDFSTPINSISQSLEKLAQRGRPLAPELEGERRTGRAGRAAPDSGRANGRAAACGRASAGGKDVSHA